MNNQYFSIQKINFDLNFSSKERAYKLQNTISNIFRQELHSSINNFFERKIPADIVIKKDALTLNLGTIPYQKLEKELTERVMTELEKVFAKQFFYRDDILYYGGDYTSDEISISYINVLEQFLLTGVMSWVFSVNTGIDLHQIFIEIYEKNKEALKHLLKQAGKHSFVRTRLTYQFAEDDIKKIVELVEPSYAGYICEYHANITRAQQQKQIVKSGTDDFKRSLWNFILTFLLDEKGSVFNKKMFVKSTLLQIAAHFNIHYADLLQLLYDEISLQKNHFTETQDLPLLILELSDELESGFSISKNNTANSFNTNIFSLSEKMDLLRYYLLYGTLPYALGSVNKKDIESYFIELVKTIPAAFRKMIAALNIDFDNARKIYYLFDFSILSELIKLLSPLNDSFFIQYLSSWETIEREKILTGTENLNILTCIFQQTLVYLLTHQKVLPDKKQFIEESIYQVQHKFNISTNIILNALFEISIKNSRQDVTNSHTLYSKLLEEHKSKFLTFTESDLPFPGKNAGEETIENNDKTIKILSLKDVVLHLLIYGTMPWWGKEYISRSFESLLNELFLYSETEVISIVKFAGIDDKMKRRFLWHVSQESIKKLAGHFPQSIEALEAYEDLSRLIFSSEVFSSAPGNSIQFLLLETFWNVYINANYASFDESLFYKIVIQQLSSVLQSRELEVAEVLTTSLDELTKTDFFPTDKLKKLQLILESARQSDQEEVSNKSYFLNTLPAAQKYFLEIELLSSEERIRKLQIVLEHYLCSDKFPDELSDLDSREASDTLKEILLILFHENREALQSILNKEHHSPLARIHLHDIFSEQMGGEEKKVAHILQPYQENDIKQYLLHTTGSAQLPDFIFIKQKIADFINDRTEKLAAKFPTDAITSSTFASSIAHPLTDAEINDFINNLSKSNKGNADYIRKLIEILLGKIEDSVEKQQLLSQLNLISLPTFARSLTKGTEDHKREIIKILLANIKNVVEKERLISQLDLMSSPTFARLIARSLTDPKIDDLIYNFNKLTNGIHEYIKAIKKILLENIDNDIEKDRLRLLMNEFNLMFSFSKFYINSNNDYLRNLIKYISNNTNFESNFFEKIITSLKNKQAVSVSALPLVAAIAKAIEERIVIGQRNKAIKTSLDSKSKEQKDIEIKRQKSQLENIEQELKKLKQQEEGSNKKKLPTQSANEEDKIYISNCGLVLLHPFLSTYFTRLNLLEKGKFVTEETRVRAALLLQYLATGTASFEEHQLVLNKILCSISLEQPVPKEIELRPEETEVSNELLKVVIERSGKLVNSSIEGFRASFLQREGAMKKVQEDWNLRVDQKGYDVLLEYLPWAFSLIKLSWMDKTIFVEWI